MSKFDPQAYLNAFKDIRLAYEDLGKKGKYDQNKGAYRKALNRGLGDEANWVKRLSDSTGRRGTDVSDYTAGEFAKMHYDLWGSKPKENRLGQQAYKDAYGIQSGEANNPGGSKDNKKDATVDTETFQSLLNKLEGSKKRQQRQKSVEGRRDTYAQGLASMMRNF